MKRVMAHSDLAQFLREKKAKNESLLCEMDSHFKQGSARFLARDNRAVQRGRKKKVTDDKKGNGGSLNSRSGKSQSSVQKRQKLRMIDGKGRQTVRVLIGDSCNIGELVCKFITKAARDEYDLWSLKAGFSTEILKLAQRHRIDIFLLVLNNIRYPGSERERQEKALELINCLDRISQKPIIALYGWFTDPCLPQKARMAGADFSAPLPCSLYPVLEIIDNFLNEKTYKPFLIHVSKKDFKCVGLTLTARNRSLNRKYPGGAANYIRTHGARSNGKICVACFVGSDIDGNIADLEKNGLTCNEDFFAFDATSLSLQNSQPAKSQGVDVGVDWLKCLVSDLGVTVSYIDNKDKVNATEKRV